MKELLKRFSELKIEGITLHCVAEFETSPEVIVRLKDGDFYITTHYGDAENAEACQVLIEALNRMGLMVSCIQSRGGVSTCICDSDGVRSYASTSKGSNSLNPCTEALLTAVCEALEKKND